MGLGNNPLATEGDRFIKNTVEAPAPQPAALRKVLREEPDAGTEQRGRVARAKAAKHVKSFSLEEHLVQRLRAFAFHEEEKASAVVSKALHQYLSERGY